MIKVFYTDISPLSDKTEGFVLSGYRLKRLESISHPLTRKQSIGAELLLNYAVNEIFPNLIPPFEIKEGEYGKPSFEDIPLHFSLSHSGNTVACAVSDANIGLDVEENLKHRPQVAERFFTEAEQGRLSDASDKGCEFARIWTAKESALKFIGKGLHMPLLDVHTQQHSVTLYPEIKKLALAVFETQKLVISVCSEKHEDNVEFKFIKI